MFIKVRQGNHAIHNSVGVDGLFSQIFGVGLSMTTETIAYFNDEEPPKDQADEHLLWASREVLAGAGFSEKSDVYSFGIVLWEIMQADGSLPYDGLRQEEVTQKHQHTQHTSYFLLVLKYIPSEPSTCLL